jgi:hypothetical protein
MCTEIRGKGVPALNAPAAQDDAAPQFEKLLSDASAAFI